MLEKKQHVVLSLDLLLSHGWVSEVGAERSSLPDTQVCNAFKNVFSSDEDSEYCKYGQNVASSGHCGDAVQLWLCPHRCFKQPQFLDQNLVWFHTEHLQWCCWNQLNKLSWRSSPGLEFECFFAHQISQFWVWMSSSVGSWMCSSNNRELQTCFLF